MADKPAPQRSHSVGSKSDLRAQRDAKRAQKESEQRLRNSVYHGFRAVPVVRRVPTQVAPVGFRGIPTLVREIWLKLGEVGGKLFEPYDNQEHLELVIKVMLYLCQAKIAFAHRKAPSFECARSQDLSYMDESLESLAQAGAALPKPLAIAVDTYGFWNIGMEDIVPIVDNDAASGIHTFSPSRLGENLSMLTTAWRSTEEIGGHVLPAIRKLDPEFEWENLPREDEEPLHRVPGEFAARWEFPDVPSVEDMTTFSLIMQTQSERSEWMFKCDLKCGVGAPAQIVQFKDKEMDGDVRMYSVSRVTQSDYVLAAAIRHGDTDFPPATRYTVGDHETAIQLATANCGACRSVITKLPPLPPRA